MNIIIIGEFIKKKRIEMGITQLELSNLLNVSHQAVSRWEKGDNLPDVVKLSELCKLFGVSIDEMINQNNEDKRIKNKSNNLKFFRLINSVFAVISVILYYLLIFTSGVLWIPVLTQYLLVLGISLIYIIPFALLEEKTEEDFTHVRISLLFSLGALLLTLNTFFYGNYGIEIELFIIGAIIATPILWLIHIFLKSYGSSNYSEPNSVKRVEYSELKKEIAKYILYIVIGLMVIMSYGLLSDTIVGDATSSMKYLYSFLLIISLVPFSYYLKKEKSFGNVILLLMYILLSVHHIRYSYISNYIYNQSDWKIFEDIEYALIATFVALVLTYVIYIIIKYVKEGKFNMFKSKYTIYLIIVSFMQLLSRLLGTESYNISVLSDTSYRYHITYVIEANLYTYAIVVAIIFIAVVDMYNEKIQIKTV